MHELRGGREPTLEEQIGMLSPCDLALVEGYKSNDLIPKLEVYRPSHGKPPIHPEHPNIVAIASDAPVATALPLLDINDPDAIVEFIVNHLELDCRPRGGGAPAGFTLPRE
jgi:molybdopterin-guanine dinucleotide biosynthesis protein B